MGTAYLYGKRFGLLLPNGNGWRKVCICMQTGRKIKCVTLQNPSEGGSHDALAITGLTYPADFRSLSASGEIGRK